jgi:hypothetical protein
MARPKSFILPMSVDRALKSHTCKHNEKHGIAKGDVRLKTFIAQAIERLKKLSADLEG